MQSKTLYLLLAFAVTIAAVTAFYDDDEDDLLTDFQEYMLEKRARKGKGGRKGKGKGKGKGGSYYDDCPNNPRCICAFDKSGTLLFEASCRQINAAGVGI